MRPRDQILGHDARVQLRLYIHNCTLKHCMKRNCQCRYFFPWPKQIQQQYDENMQRIAYQRRYVPDDKWVIAHQYEMMCSETGVVQVQAWDPYRNAAHGKLYATKHPAVIVSYG